ncbi:MAG TPA: hypothetical protein VFO48_04095, partial [Vicinamibacterales bacterium]|nr:hypothetical protein [Vicinamibacterales bacterium]
MASQSRKTNGSNGGHGRGIDTKTLRSRAELVTVSAAGIARIADEVAQGSVAQLGTLDEALGDMNEIVASLGETAIQAESATNSSEALVSSVNEIAASIEQVSANTASLSSSIGQTAASA